MEKRQIRLIYRKVINAATENLWEKYIIDHTYKEFLMQAQLYNTEKKYGTFAELKNHVPDSQKINFLVSGSVNGYLKQLQGKVPDILNNIGKLFLPFERYKFEIIDSDLGDKTKHRIAIEFISEPMMWYGTIDNLLLVAINHNKLNEDEEILTDTFALQPYLSIYSVHHN